MIISHIVTHVHLKTYFKFALHKEDEDDDPHRADDSPKHQLDPGPAGEAVADMVLSLCPSLSVQGGRGWPLGVGW